MDFYTRLGGKTHFRSSAAEAFYRTMLEEAGVTVLPGRCLESAKMDGKRIVSAKFETFFVYCLGF